MIPVLGIPILNRPNLLNALIDTIDVEIGQLIIIDNGGVVGPFVRGDVITMPHNIGVAASWNLIIKSTPLAKWWLITNSDIEFGHGALETLANTVEPNRPAIYQMLGFAAFAITPSAVERVGFFDENFHPAYCEDIDYARRATLAGVPIVDVPSELRHVGSATIYGDQHYMRLNGNSYPSNVAYYERKWGGTMHGGEQFSVPFNAGGDIRDTRVDFARLRGNAWRRRQ